MAQVADSVEGANWYHRHLRGKKENAMPNLPVKILYTYLGRMLQCNKFTCLGAVKRLEPASNDLASMNFTMDVAGKVTEFVRGEKMASFLYDGFGRLTEQSFGMDRNILTRKFAYETPKSTWVSEC